jgi:hypothetical protein
MRGYLYEICDQMTAHHATAPQRCEALLRAIGKWRDDTKVVDTCAAVRNSCAEVKV